MYTWKNRFAEKYSTLSEDFSNWETPAAASRMPAREFQCGYSSEWPETICKQKLKRWDMKQRKRRKKNIEMSHLNLSSTWNLTKRKVANLYVMKVVREGKKSQGSLFEVGKVQLLENKRNTGREFSKWHCYTV